MNKTQFAMKKYQDKVEKNRRVNFHYSKELRNLVNEKNKKSVKKGLQKI